MTIPSSRLSRAGRSRIRSIVAAAGFAFGCVVFAAHADEARYDVAVEAPGTLKALVEDNLSLIRWRDADGRRGRIDEDQLRRLFDDGKDEILRLVATEGYYRPTVDADLEQKGDRWTAHYRIAPGPLTSVAAVELQFLGPIAQAPPGSQPDPDALRANWRLAVGDVFRQADWEADKRRLVQALLIRTYPFASITHSEAKVDVRTDTAQLSVSVASGPAVRFGPLQISGLQRYPEDIVRNLDPIKLGEPYSQAQVFEFQQRLGSSGYFSRVEVSIDAVADPGSDPRSPFVTPAQKDGEGTGQTTEAPATPLPREVTLPLRVLVEENKAKTVSVGLGLSTNAGPRASLGYNVINFGGGGKQLRTALSLDSLTQSLGADLLFPQTAAGNRYSISSYVKRDDVQNEVTRSAGVTGKRSWGPAETERFTTLDYIYEQKDIDRVPQVSTQIVGTTYGVTLRRTDSLLTPTRGYLASGTVGGGVRLATGQPYARAYGKAVRYQPLGDHDTLLVRGELGAIAGSNTETLPSTLLFRAGGQGSVRGYGYQSLGIRQADAIVGGRFVATGTVEGIHWLGPRYPEWGVAAFVDAGNAGNRFSQLDPVYGYGVGARWRSPVGVLDLDVAHGVQNRSTRLHFSLGVTF